MLATTSLAVIVLPLWNFTPLRIWKVQTVALAFGFQLVASHGNDPALRVRERQVLGRDAGERQRPALVEQVRLERGAEGRDADAQRAAALDGFPCGRG